MNRPTRRQFLRAAATGGVACALANVPGIGLTQMSGGGSFNDYKAIVCVFLLGGNDSWNMIVPRSDAEYAVYAASRQNLAVPQASLLPLNLATPDASGWSFGINAAMPGVASLFNAGQCAVVANVGPLIAPTTLAAYQGNSVALPPQLFSHNDQQDQWHTLQGRAQLKTGWGGRIADLLAPATTNQQLALGLSLFGETLFEVGATSIPYTMGPSGPVSFAAFDSSSLGVARRAAFQSILGASYDTIYERAFAAIQQRAVQFADLASSALAGAPAITALPDDASAPLSSFATQLQTVAKLIAVRDTLQMSRQIFFVAATGFDTHADQAALQPALLGTISDGLQRFYEATVQLGVASQVTTFTQSDFGRTLTSNGQGTDHGWGSVQLVSGGAVAGGKIFGSYPLLKIGAAVATERADDVGGGRFIPTTSSDQYAATLARWFGVTAAADLATVAPSIGNFAQADLGLFR